MRAHHNIRAVTSPITVRCWRGCDGGGMDETQVNTLLLTHMKAPYIIAWIYYPSNKMVFDRDITHTKKTAHPIECVVECDGSAHLPTELLSPPPPTVITSWRMFMTHTTQRCVFDIYFAYDIFLHPFFCPTPLLLVSLQILSSIKRYAHFGCHWMRNWELVDRKYRIQKEEKNMHC